MRNGRGMSGLVFRSSITAQYLADELHEDARRDQRVDDDAERSRLQTIEMQPEHEQRDVRELAWSGAAGRTP